MHFVHHHFTPSLSLLLLVYLSLCRETQNSGHTFSMPLEPLMELKSYVHHHLQCGVHAEITRVLYLRTAYSDVVSSSNSHTLILAGKALLLMLGSFMLLDSLELLKFLMASTILQMLALGCVHSC